MLSQAAAPEALAKGPASDEPATSSTEQLHRRVGRALGDLAVEFSPRGLPSSPLRGQLLRPLVALLGLPSAERSAPGRSFWCGALAIQMVHEASLLHDDIIDQAATRRGAPTSVARMGVGPALVRGDHLLTAAYRVALDTRVPRFIETFVRAVERTVAGELEQGLHRGQRIGDAEYLSIVSKKSGELFAAALVLSSSSSGPDSEAGLAAAGRGLGVFYQRVDDLLDCCSAADLGKPPFQDYRHGHWTWVFETSDLEDFGLPESGLRESLFGGAGADELLHALTIHASEVMAGLDEAVPDPDALLALVGSWLERARLAVEAEHASLRASPPLRPASTLAREFDDPEERIRARASELGGPSEWRGYFRHHSRTFSHAARLFPRRAAESVEGIYAFCRFTDDIVDGRSAPTEQVEAELDAWASLAGEAYRRGRTGVALLDDVLGGARRQGIPFTYAQELIRGVAMDLRPRVYESMADLRIYTHRVASVVGLWLTESFGQRDPWVLSRAAALGHALQLTNILRDVGEDLRMGRLYLPTDRMALHGLKRSDLEAALARGALPAPAYHALLESLMGDADRDYGLAMEAIPSLPRFAQRPIAVAARVYQGIHQRIRDNGYDNLRLRAHTGSWEKLRLSWIGLRDLRSARRLGPASEGGREDVVS